MSSEWQSGEALEVPSGYRPNVCAVITEAPEATPRPGARVLMFRRVNPTLGAFRWQFPQGGLDPGETPEQGLLRELREEVGAFDHLNR